MPDASTSSAEAREQLILEHVPLVKHLVGRLGFDAPGLDRDDLCGVGMIGLVAAADAWDEERGVAFSTFAYADRGDPRRTPSPRRLPRGRRERVRELDKLVQQLAHEQGVPRPRGIATAPGSPSTSWTRPCATRRSRKGPPWTRGRRVASARS